MRFCCTSKRNDPWPPDLPMTTTRASSVRRATSTRPGLPTAMPTRATSLPWKHQNSVPSRAMRVSEWAGSFRQHNMARPSTSVTCTQSMQQTPSTGLQHPSFNHRRIQLCRKGSENRQLTSNFSVGAHTVVSWLQTTQTFVLSDFCFITDHVAYASSKKTKIV